MENLVKQAKELGINLTCQKPTKDELLEDIEFHSKKIIQDIENLQKKHNEVIKLLADVESCIVADKR